MSPTTRVGSGAVAGGASVSMGNDNTSVGPTPPKCSRFSSAMVVTDSRNRRDGRFVDEVDADESRRLDAGVSEHRGNELGPRPQIGARVAVVVHVDGDGGGHGVERSARSGFGCAAGRLSLRS